MKPKILIAEGQPVFRIGTQFLLKELFPDACILEAGNITEVMQLLHKSPIELLIIEIQIGGRNNMKTVKLLNERYPKLQILIFTNCDEKLFALDYFKAGATGYIQKNCSLDEFKSAIITLLNKESYLSRGVQQLFLNGWGHNPKKNSQTVLDLSVRENEIMHLLVKGLPTQEIMDILKIKPSTLSTHKSNIFSKLKVKNILELAKMVQHGI